MTNIESIIKITANRFELTTDTLLIKSRQPIIKLARNIAITIILENKYTLQECADYFSMHPVYLCFKRQKFYRTMDKNSGHKNQYIRIKKAIEDPFKIFEN
jgi:hypothetical protein